MISGNVSLYNETDGQAIYPTPMIGMVGVIEDVSQITTQAFKQVDDLIYLIGETHADFNGSEVQKMQLGRIEGQLRSFDLKEEKANQELVLKAIQAGLVASAHDCAEGGVAVALAESAFANELGLQVTLPLTKEYLFAETQSRFILSVSPQHQEAFETLIGRKAQHIGKVTETGLVIHALDDVINCSTKEAKALWEDAIPCLMKQKA